MRIQRVTCPCHMQRPGHPSPCDTLYYRYLCLRGGGGGGGFRATAQADLADTCVARGRDVESLMSLWDLSGPPLCHRAATRCASAAGLASRRPRTCVALALMGGWGVAVPCRGAQGGRGPAGGWVKGASRRKQNTRVACPPSYISHPLLSEQRHVGLPEGFWRVTPLVVLRPSSAACWCRFCFCSVDGYSIHVKVISQTICLGLFSSSRVEATGISRPHLPMYPPTYPKTCFFFILSGHFLLSRNH